jgi:hypothetical protein
MGYRRRRLYVPITRSDSSILASIITQAIDESRRKRYAEIQTRLERGEIKLGYAFFLMHPILCFWLAGSLLGVALAILFR